MNIVSTCTKCGRPISNAAEDGRPDLWDHSDYPQDRPYCGNPTPPQEIADGLPREMRKVRMRVKEQVTYDWEMEIEMHAGVTSDALASYLTDYDEEWIDEMGEHEYSAGDREIVEEHTFLADDAGYLANLADGIKQCNSLIRRWLTIVCPVCGVQPDQGDTAHQLVGWFVGIACDGARLVNPEWIWMDGTGWTDWTQPQPETAAK